MNALSPQHALAGPIPVFSCFSADSDLPSRVLRSQTTRTPSFPRRVSAPGVLHRCFTHPESRGGRSAEKRSGACEAPVGRIMTRYARRLRGALRPMARQDARERAYDAGRSPLGAPPWRFFTRGRASFSGMTRIRRASSSQPGRSAWRAGSRASRGERLRSPPPQDASPRSAFRIVSRTRPQ